MILTSNKLNLYNNTQVETYYHNYVINTGVENIKL